MEKKIESIAETVCTPLFIPVHIYKVRLPAPGQAEERVPQKGES
jgi:hypothetical protein